MKEIYPTQEECDYIQAAIADGCTITQAVQDAFPELVGKDYDVLSTSGKIIVHD